ncbi:polymorphic toxin type 50 domain-containing protein [Limosilactobacillus reuteri]|uniref:polymorphic toxin type 50 domain-containing protein n=1 Tax=Limosilactobacillus reuteri TaxID=1598 RepID=UPI001C5A9150|nr:polymorphic toxin type 50 domain-containing protein [Limosilactobacillus reuteri]MBW3349859.1 hypothetical protein [Limosilactobacillus reuteri]UUW67708.1 polymorphic toxin type 50 domain-containing protein [Limosilactobacillus reuteri]
MTTVQQEKKRIEQLLSRDDKTDKQLETVYNEGVDMLKAIINEIFTKYAIDGVLVPANLSHKVTRSDMMLLKRQFDKLPDDLELPAKEREDYYIAVSQNSQKSLITAVVGMALIGLTYKAKSIIHSNNQTATKEEVDYLKKNNDFTKTQQKRLNQKAKQVAQPDYKLPSQNDIYVSWPERLWLDHDRLLNRIDDNINIMLKKGMTSADIADVMFPGNAESMRQDNIPKAMRDAAISAKRIARSEAASREDELDEQAFKAKKVKYFGWVTEKGACKKCISISLAGPYKVGDPDSPRIPSSSHPNCRCRRIPVDGGDLDDRALALMAGLASGVNKKSDNKKSSDKGSDLDTESIINERFDDGVWLDKINSDKQKRHLPVDIKQTPQDGKSRTIFNSDVNVEELYNKYKGTGHISKDRNGNMKPTELITTDKVLAYDNKGRKLYGFKIHYSKTGVHLVPWKGDGNSEFK